MSIRSRRSKCCKQRRSKRSSRHIRSKRRSKPRKRQSKRRSKRRSKPRKRRSRRRSRRSKSNKRRSRRRSRRSKSNKRRSRRRSRRSKSNKRRSRRRAYKMIGGELTELDQQPQRILNRSALDPDEFNKLNAYMKTLSIHNMSLLKLVDEIFKIDNNADVFIEGSFVKFLHNEMLEAPTKRVGDIDMHVHVEFQNGLQTIMRIAQLLGEVGINMATHPIGNDLLFGSIEVPLIENDPSIKINWKDSRKKNLEITIVAGNPTQFFEVYGIPKIVFSKPSTGSPITITLENVIDSYHGMDHGIDRVNIRDIWDGVTGPQLKRMYDKYIKSLELYIRNNVDKPLDRIPAHILVKFAQNGYNVVLDFSKYVVLKHGVTPMSDAIITRFYQLYQESIAHA